MTHYSETIAAIVQQAKTREDALPLLNESCRSRFFLQPNPTQRVCLFLHGFTAGPYQFAPMAETFFKAGYNVLVPLLPGHGQAGNWSSQNPPPLPTDPAVYQQFALHWLEQAQALGKEVVVGGLSAGGTLTAWLALERPQVISRAVLFAAYLSSSSRMLDLFMKKIDTYVAWKVTDANPSKGYGYDGFAMPALRLFLNLGQDILKRSEQQAIAPLFILSSESDMATGSFDHKTLFENALSHQPITWYNVFSHELAIPHTMMTVAEGNRWASLLPVMTKAFVESNLTWEEVQEIGYRMTQGKTFPSVVAELGLSAKASPDMPAMMTMVDKRSIAISRNPSMVDEA